MTPGIPFRTIVADPPWRPSLHKNTHHGQGVRDVFNLDFFRTRIDRPKLSTSVSLHPIAYAVHY